MKKKEKEQMRIKYMNLQNQIQQLELEKQKRFGKEKPFYFNIPAKELYEEVESEETILVQGIIDLYFVNENDEIILVDYKTDYTKTEEELSGKYKKQLELYKRALEIATGKKVASSYIYSTYLGREILVEQINKIKNMMMFQITLV